MAQIYLTSKTDVVFEKIEKLFPKNHAKEVLFIENAADVYDAKPFVEEDKDKLIAAGYKIKILDLINKSRGEIQGLLDTHQILFVSGGNIFYLKQVLEKTGFEKLLRSFLKREDSIYIGGSAGACILGNELKPFEHFDDISKAPELINTKGLEIVPFQILPHWATQKYEDRYLKVLRDFYRLGTSIHSLTNEQAIMAYKEEIILIT